MQKNHAKAIKGMSIAALVLSGISIVLSLLCIIIFSFASDLLYTYGKDAIYDLYDYQYGDMFDMSYGHGHSYGHDIYPYGYGLDVDDYTYLYPAVFGMLNGMMVFVLVCSVVSLIASIMGLRLEQTPKSLKNGFVWFIVGAVVSGISIGLPTCVLFILMAVFANMDKKLIEGQYAQPYGAYGAPNAPIGGVQQNAYPPQGQPVNTNTQQSYGQQQYGQQQNGAYPEAQPAAPYEPERASNQVQSWQSGNPEAAPAEADIVATQVASSSVLEPPTAPPISAGTLEAAPSDSPASTADPNLGGEAITYKEVDVIVDEDDDAVIMVEEETTIIPDTITDGPAVNESSEGDAANGGTETPDND